MPISKSSKIAGAPRIDLTPPTNRFEPERKNACCTEYFDCQDGNMLGID
jgi:hypothetical protein